MQEDSCQGVSVRSQVVTARLIVMVKTGGITRIDLDYGRICRKYIYWSLKEGGQCKSVEVEVHNIHNCQRGTECSIL